MLYFVLSFGIITSLPSFAQETGFEIDDGGISELTSTTVESTQPEPRITIKKEEQTQQNVVPSIVTRVPREPAERIQIIAPSVDTISQAQIRAQQRYDLSSVLRRSAGVSVVSNGAEGTLTSIFTRGSESDHTVILLNGRRLPRGLSGQHQTEFQDITNLESVQYSRGPSSSLYGSDALGGAIDLRITDARFVESNTLSAFGEVGSFDTERGGGKLTIRDGAVGISFDGSYLDTSNDRPRSNFDNGTIRGNVAITLGDGIYFDVLGSVQDAFLQVPGSRFANNFPQQQTNANQSSLVSPRISIRRNDWDFSTYFSSTQNELVALQAPFGNDNILSQTGQEWESFFHYRPNENATFTLGAGHYEYGFDRTPVGPFATPAAFEYSLASVFAQADVALPANFHLLTSGRYDSHDSFESKGTYTVQLGHTISSTETTILGKVGTGYKAPTGQDLLFTNNITRPDQLKPEDSQTYEFGIEQEIFDGRGSFAVTYFKYEIDNLIDNDPITFAASQVDTASDGFEFELQLAANENIDLYANYTYLNARVTDGVYRTTDQPGTRLIRRPRHTLNAGVIYTAESWSLGAEITGAFDSTDGLFPTTIPLKDFTTARFFGSVEITRNLELFGRIENVFDDTYDYTRGFRAPGTAAYVGARIVLSGD